MATFTLILSDTPFGKENQGESAPFLKTVEHGADIKISTPATDAYCDVLDALGDRETKRVARMKVALIGLKMAAETALLPLDQYTEIATRERYDDERDIYAAYTALRTAIDNAAACLEDTM